MADIFACWFSSSLTEKKENLQTKPPGNTSHLAFLTLEPANIVPSIFVPFPIPTTAKREEEMLLQNSPAAPFFNTIQY